MTMKAMDEKLKAAVETLEAFGNEISDPIQTLLNLARRYLDCPGWPIKQDIGKDVHKPGTPEGNIYYYMGWNDALERCRQARAKEIAERPGVEEIQEVLDEHEVNEYFHTPILAQALSSRLEKGKA